MMKGWKTWMGVAGVLVSQLAGTVLGVDMGEAQSQAGPLLEFVQAAFGALAVIGIGHKIEKNGLAD